MPSLKDIAVKMMERGIDIPTIAEIVGTDQGTLQDIRSGLDITVKQDDVVEAMNRLAWAAYEKGLHILQEGTPAMQMRLIQMMLSQMRNLMGSQSPKQMAGLIQQFKDTIEMHEDDEDDDPDATDDIEEDQPDA